MKHVPFEAIHEYLGKRVWPDFVYSKGEKANFRKACKQFLINDGELHYKKVQADETGEKVEVRFSCLFHNCFSIHVPCVTR